MAVVAALAHVDVAAGDLQGSLTAFTTANQNALQRQAYTGGKRYLRAIVTSATVTTGGTVGAVILLAQGGGVVEGYPHEIGEKRMNNSFVYNGMRTMYEEAGFTYDRPKGQGNCVMVRKVPPGLRG